MSSDESFTRASPPSSIGHGSTQNTRSPSLRAPNTQGVTYVRVGRGIVPVSLYTNNTPRGRSISGDIATTSVYGVEGETSSGGLRNRNGINRPFRGLGTFRLKALCQDEAPVLRLRARSLMPRMKQVVSSGSPVLEARFPPHQYPPLSP
ncbi:hypothetical protein RSAG8_05508, partial [Rhizoctonia solani AG-8 WAC10335]